jgi:hypothetical protein
MLMNLMIALYFLVKFTDFSKNAKDPKEVV